MSYFLHRREFWIALVAVVIFVLIILAIIGYSSGMWEATDAST
jgi:hypothetical protein